MTAPAPPAPADGARLEGGARHDAQIGTEPMPPGAVTVGTYRHEGAAPGERTAVADALDYAANDYVLVPSGDVRQTIIRAAALLRASAAPLPDAETTYAAGWQAGYAARDAHAQPLPPPATGEAVDDGAFGAAVDALEEAVANLPESCVSGCGKECGCYNDARAALLAAHASAVNAAEQAAWHAGLDEGRAQGRAEALREVDDACGRIAARADEDEETAAVLVYQDDDGLWLARREEDHYSASSWEDTPTAAILAAADALTPADATADAAEGGEA